MNTGEGNGDGSAARTVAAVRTSRSSAKATAKRKENTRPSLARDAGDACQLPLRDLAMPMRQLAIRRGGDAPRKCCAALPPDQEHDQCRREQPQSSHQENGSADEASATSSCEQSHCGRLLERGDDQRTA
jgi:hypothetical protein